jgi:hypothetical protein
LKVEREKRQTLIREECEERRRRKNNELEKGKKKNILGNAHISFLGNQAVH